MEVKSFLLLGLNCFSDLKYALTRRDFFFSPLLDRKSLAMEADLRKDGFCFLPVNNSIICETLAGWFSIFLADDDKGRENFPAVTPTLLSSSFVATATDSSAVRVTKALQNLMVFDQIQSMSISSISSDGCFVLCLPEF